jgi:predicted PurR-regulated permease PerM
MQKIKNINRVLLFILILFILLYHGSPFLVPLVFGIFFASLTAPLSNLLERIKINRILSSLISTLAIFLVTGLILYILFLQLNRFVLDIPEIGERVQELVVDVQQTIASVTDVSVEQQTKLFQHRSENIYAALENRLTSLLGNLLNIAGAYLIMMIYVFLLLYYRERIQEFFLMYVEREKKKEARDIFNETSQVVYHYLWGRVKVMALLGVMYYVTFSLFDLPYAGLLTIFGALITIIPYLGPFLSGLLPIAFAILYFESLQLTLIFTAVVILIQLTESYVFEPIIIGNEVKLNPLVVIIAITMGAMVWGLAGMILFVPMFAILKIIADHSFGLKPIGYLLGSSENS